MNEIESETMAVDGKMILTTSNMWTYSTRPLQVISSNQGGQAGDHCLKIQNGRVSCDGLMESKNTYFKLYTASFDSKGLVCMLECIGGDSDGYMLCMKNDKVYAQKKTKDYTKWDDPAPEVLFRKKPVEPGKQYCHFQSYSNENHYLAFDLSGKIIAPSSINLSDPSAEFIVWVA